uniref:Uncharacterized protein n=1 Tax=Clytia hemisphaerica TaxID=252671 RepID=A0A7M5X6X7_9CNID
LYLYTRPVEVGSLGSNLQQQEAGGLNRQPFKHWSIVIEVLDHDQEEGLPGWFICEANNEDDLLWARLRRFTQADRDKFGVELKSLKDNRAQSEIFQISLNEIETFCHAWNQKRYPYIIPDSTCQRFVDCLAKKLNVNLDEFWNLNNTLTALALGAGLLWTFISGR